MIQIPEDSYLKTSEVSRRLEVSDTYTRRLAQDGRLPHTFTRLGRLYDRAAVEQFEAERAAKRARRAVA